MGAEKHGSKNGGGYVGGFLQLFDWNAKSRRKLFSSKSDIPEQSKQKKRRDGNMPVTRVHLVNEDDTAGSSVKGSSDYSCASSVTDEEVHGIKPAGVVARLMGLDCLPTSNFSEPYSTPFLDSQSLRSTPCFSRNLEYQQNFQSVYSGNLMHEKMEAPSWGSLEPKQQKIISRPIEKFQTEILPPKSAKSIPITHCKLLSPIKSASSFPAQNAAHIMEAAARILEQGPQAPSKAKIPLIGSTSLPLKVKDLKERMEASQKVNRSAEASRRPVESIASKQLKCQPMNKSWNGLADTTRQNDLSDSNESFVGGKVKVKSVSLALQAKANVQKREAQNSGSSGGVLCQKEPSKLISNQLFTSQPGTEKNTHKKPSVHSSPSILRQNNKKQNSIADRGKSPTKTILQKRTLGNDSSVARQKSSTKMADSSKVSSRRLSREADDKKEETYACTKPVTRKKRPSDGDIHFEKNQASGSMYTDKSGQRIQSGIFMDKEMSCKAKRTDIISFTFNAPLTRSIASPEPPREVQEKCHELSADFQSKRMQLNSDGIKSPFGLNMNGGDALNILLDEKLRELTYVVESSHQRTGPSRSSSSTFQDLSVALSDLSTTDNMHHDDMEVDDSVNTGFSSIGPLRITRQHKHQGMEEENGSSDLFECSKVFGSRFPSPISVLERSFYTESCNSSDTAASNSAGASNQSSSVQAKEVFGTGSFKKFHFMEMDVDLLDSASSKEDGKHFKNVESPPNWELEYVKEILCDIELMFMDFATGRAHEIVSPYLFDQLERVNGRGHELKQRRKVLFDCVGECLDLRCRQYVEGGYGTWEKGMLLIKNKARLAEEVYREISGSSGLGNCMVDELVDKDMSNYFGRWLNFEVEAFDLGRQIEKRLLHSLIDEVVADILLL